MHPAVLAPVDRAIHRINHYPGDSLIGFPTTYAMDSDLSVGQRYPTFKQPIVKWNEGPEFHRSHTLGVSRTVFGNTGNTKSNLEYLID